MITLSGKQCSICKAVKAVDQFYPDKQRLDGRFPYCKPCNSKKASQYKLRRKTDPNSVRKIYQVVDGMKVCSGCKINKPLDDYWNYYRGNKKYPRCKDCVHKRYKQYKIKHPVAWRKNLEEQWERRKGKRRGEALRLRYGLTEEGYNEKYKSQNGLCAICKLERLLVVDHDHETRKLRELLCKGCNLALGLFKDSPEGLRRAADYIERYKK